MIDLAAWLINAGHRRDRPPRSDGARILSVVRVMRAVEDEASGLYRQSDRCFVQC